jgi:hypothetical protein
VLTFPTVNVSSLDLDSSVISWTVDLQPETIDVTRFNFFVQRSTSPGGDFDELNTTALVDTFTYLDSQMHRRSKWRAFFYRIRAVDTGVAPNVEYFSQVASLNIPSLTMQQRVRLEIIRAERILLQGVGVTPGFVGIPTLIYIRRTFGQRCPMCWDSVKKRVSMSKCLSCYGTGFYRGFHTPINTYLNFAPSTNQSELSPLGESEPNIVKAWMSNYPPLSHGDLIVDQENFRWRVVSQTRTESLRQSVRQLLTLYSLSPGDIEFSLAVNPALFEV